MMESPSDSSALTSMSTLSEQNLPGSMAEALGQDAQTARQGGAV